MHPTWLVYGLSDDVRARPVDVLHQPEALPGALLLVESPFPALPPFRHVRVVSLPTTMVSFIPNEGMMITSSSAWARWVIWRAREPGTSAGGLTLVRSQSCAKVMIYMSMRQGDMRP